MADTPFIGPTYPLLSLPASVQQTVNMSPVLIEPGNERQRWVFKDTPGLVPVEIRLPAIFYTSWPYPLFAEAELESAHAAPVNGQLWVQPLEEMNSFKAVPLSGTLHEYSQPPEELDNAHLVPLSGTLDVVLHTYDQPAEGMDNAHTAPVSGTLVVQLITYSNW